MTALQRLHAAAAAASLAWKGQTPEARVITVPAPAANPALPDLAAMRAEADAAASLAARLTDAAAKMQAVLAAAERR